MKNKKGFTLVELLVVIALIGLLIAIAVPSGLSISKKIKQKMLDTKIEQIESAAIVWGQNNKTELQAKTEVLCPNVFNDPKVDKCTSKSISDLLADNTLEEDELKDIDGNGTKEKILLNPVTNQPLNDCKIEIYQKNKRIYAKYDITGNNCYNEPEEEVETPEEVVEPEIPEEEPETPEEEVETPEEVVEPEIPEEEVPKDVIMKSRNAHNSSENYYQYKSKIKKIYFVNHINHGATSINCDNNTDLKWCVADTSDGTSEDKIIAWLEQNGSNYNLYIGSKGQIYAPTNSSNFFKDFTVLESIDFDNFNTTNVIDMSSMFFGCNRIKTLNLNNFITENVIDMSSMFYNCSNLTTLYLNNFNTTNVIDMSSMFYGCSSLNSINLKKFNTINVTNMFNMFRFCKSLGSLDLRNFNTENVTNMGYMFFGCESLTNLYLNNFNTENVTNMRQMFSNCESLTTLDLSNFNTPNIKYMGFMFDKCESLTTLDISNFNTASIRYQGGDMSDVFASCTNLKTIYLNDTATRDDLKSSKPAGATFYNK